jgi:hypothetical protein
LGQAIRSNGLAFDEGCGHERRLLPDAQQAEISERGDDMGNACVQKVELFR